MKIPLLAVGMLLAVSLAAGGAPAPAANIPKPVNAKKFDALARRGARVYEEARCRTQDHRCRRSGPMPRRKHQGWSSKMAVVGPHERYTLGGQQGQ